MNILNIGAINKDIGVVDKAFSDVGMTVCLKNGTVVKGPNCALLTMELTELPVVGIIKYEARIVDSKAISRRLLIADTDGRYTGISPYRVFGCPIWTKKEEGVLLEKIIEALLKK